MDSHTYECRICGLEKELHRKVDGCRACNALGLNTKQGVKKMKLKTKYALCALFVIGLLAFIAYGLETDCPDTAIYYYCGDE